MASKANTGFPTKTPHRRVRRLITALVAASFLSQPALAQNRSSRQSLEDLIPDSAVESPDEWAQQGASEEQPSPDDAIEVLEPDSPLAEMPELTVSWPDQLEFPVLVDLEPEEGTDFAELDVPPMPTLPDADLVQISDEIALAFPGDQEQFPERDEFVERFSQLSTVVQLGGGDDNIAQLAARARQDQDILMNLLRIYGYYDGQTIRTIGGIQPGDDEAGNNPTVRFDVLPSVRYRFGAIDLGQLDTAPDYEFLREKFAIESGDPMSSDRIVRQQFTLDSALGETGYPFAAITAPELLIDHARIEGDLTMLVQPNGKYVFGEVTSDMPDFLSGDHFASIARFDPGDVYQRSMEQDLRRAITATGLISSVLITPREVTPPSEDEPGVVAMDVAITQAPLRTIAGAIGYGSEEGFRLQASWEHRNIFPPEGALRARSILGTQEQLVGVTVTKNNFGGRDRILSVDGYVSTIDSDAFDARTIALVGSYERTSTLLFQKPLSWSFGIEAIATSERPAKIDNITPPRETFFIGALPISALIDTSDSLLDPVEGFRLGGRWSPEVSSNDGAQSFYLRSQIDASIYRRVGSGTVLAARARFGTIPGTDISNIALSRRYYAGGGGSVRGYGYQQIGPRDEQGEPSGGRSLVEFSFEARVKTGLMGGAISVVPFIDAGSVSPDPTPDFEDIRFGAGVGLRYDTGFGPIRFDVGTPLNPGPNDNPVAVYISLGQAF